MTEEALWELGTCSECQGAAKRVPNSPFGTWTHDGVKPCKGWAVEKFIPNDVVVDVREEVASAQAVASQQ